MSISPHTERIRIMKKSTMKRIKTVAHNMGIQHLRHEIRQKKNMFWCDDGKHIYSLAISKTPRRGDVYHTVYISPTFSNYFLSHNIIF